ncbi:hypothetical protein AB4156_45165, partial [Cupriavidus sp. 2MCAB6]|uniref:hypothetical protein n=1 Tax=Cupriavidus sp. 2MCAB6 TaxID=3232981 RepID=UPI003F8F3652
EETDAKERYARRYPKSKLYLDLPDACLYRVEVEALQINGGPAQNANEVTAAALKTELSGAEALMSRAADEIDRLNSSAADPPHCRSLTRIRSAGFGEPERDTVVGFDIPSVNGEPRDEEER